MKKSTAAAKVVAKNTQAGLELYLNMAGEEHLLVTRRHNGLLWEMLKGGKTVQELSRIAPERSRKAQKRHHSASYILRVVDDYINYELAA